MKVSELSGAMLDYWVAKAEGIEDDEIGERIVAQGSKIISRVLDVRMSIFAPHRRWEHGGPIIERIGIWLHHFDVGAGKQWYADIPGEGGNPDINPNPKPGEPGHIKGTAAGPTPLIAAMRAYVASKYGEEVPSHPAAQKDDK